MVSKTIHVGERGRKCMPYSEVCMYMRIAGKEMDFEVVSQHAVQLYRDGKPFSMPILTGEAGLFHTDDGFYYNLVAAVLS